MSLIVMPLDPHSAITLCRLTSRSTDQIPSGPYVSWTFCSLAGSSWQRTVYCTFADEPSPRNTEAASSR